jgi:hypothetical protein
MSEYSVSSTTTVSYSVSSTGTVGSPPQALPGQGKFRCTVWQIKWAALLIGLIALFLGGMLIFRFETTSLLFTDPLGQKMLLGAGLALVLGIAAGLLTGLFLDKVFARWSKRHLLLGLVAGLQVFFFIRPVVFVILVGPAAISIVNNLVKP